MKHRRLPPTLKLIPACCVMLMVAGLSLYAASTDALVPAGASKIDITPAQPIWLSGYAARTAEATAAAQPLWAKAIAFGEDAQISVLVTVDNVGVPAAVTEEVFERVTPGTGIARENFAVCSTHTHSGPMLKDVLPNLFSRDLTAEEQARVDAYTATLVDRMTQVVLAAVANRQPAHIFWGQGSVSFACNRRTAGGPVDRSLPLLCIKSPEGAVRALLVNYACHGTTLGPEFNEHHGDWAGEAQARMEQAHPGAVAMVSLGCGGDANPQPRTGLNYAQQHGQSVAAEVDRLLSGPLKQLTEPPVAHLEQLKLPYVPLPTRAEWESRALQGGIVGYHARKNLARLDRGETLPTTLPYSVQTWTFGSDLAMVFLPGEVVVDYELRLKSTYDPERLWVNGYANDVPCYIPSVRILKEGGYEAETSMWYYDRPARLDPASEGLIADAVGAQLPAAFLPPPDTSAPRLVSAATLDGFLVGARFDRPPERGSAGDPANYRVDGFPIVTNAALRADGKSVSLRLQNGVTGPFTLSAKGVLGLWSNTVYSEVICAQLPLTLQDIGVPLEPGSALALGNGDMDVRAAGRDIWEQADVFNFIHQPRTGDFDVRVQVTAFQGTASSAKAALMVRENLTPGSRHFTLTVYPAQGNWTAFWRLAPDGTSAVASGNWRVAWPGNTYPNVWLRLRRTGDQFTLYGGSNGHDWIQVGDAFNPVPVYPSTVNVGLATTSMSEIYSGVPAANVEYRNFGDIGTLTPPVLKLVRLDSFIQLSWPAPASGYQLQTAPGAAGGSWNSTSNRPVFFNGQCSITLPAPLSDTFYRLRSPETLSLVAP